MVQVNYSVHLHQFYVSFLFSLDARPCTVNDAALHPPRQHVLFSSIEYDTPETKVKCYPLGHRCNNYSQSIVAHSEDILITHLYDLLYFYSH